MFFILPKNIYSSTPPLNLPQSLINPSNSSPLHLYKYIVKTLVRPSPTSTQYTACNSVRHLRPSVRLSACLSGKFFLSFSCKSVLYCYKIKTSDNRRRFFYYIVISPREFEQKTNSFELKVALIIKKKQDAILRPVFVF